MPAAAAVAEFLSPATTHVMTVLAAMFAAVVTVSTRFGLVNAGVPALNPVQV